ncbi:MAG: RHS repeat-associated core domain-containing protein [Bacillales bacterium]|nr:RHS repeat-associated core domain-containing protein [Bacillales bacterium]
MALKCIYNPYLYKGYYYDSEIKLYYCNTRYYSPELCRWISIDAVDYLDPSTLEDSNLYVYCGNNPVMGYDPDGEWDWGTFWEGVGLVATAVVAIALAVTTFGAGIPIAMAVIAGITLGAGILTGINGIATIVEAGADYNFVRDGMFNEVLGLSDNAYNVYSEVTEGVAIVGSMILGVYHTTGQYKAAKYGQKMLGNGYSKEGPGRWVSEDGMRQMRLDGGHLYKGQKLGNHINIDYFRYGSYWEGYTKIGKKIHILYKWFSYWFF